MKILNIVFSITLFLLLWTSITLANDPPMSVLTMGKIGELSLKVEALLKQWPNTPDSLNSYASLVQNNGKNPISFSVKVTNISQTNQGFYHWDDEAMHNLIVDTDSIKIDRLVYNHRQSMEETVYCCKKELLMPSENYAFTTLGKYHIRKLRDEPVTFRIGFIYLDQDGKRDISKEVIWSNPLKV